jgi:hemerythrin
LAKNPTNDYKLDMSRIVKKLTDYTVYHFGSEEQLMQQYGYPELASHKIEHKSFVKEVFTQIKRLSNDNPSDSFKLYAFLMDWLINHIGKSDALWAKYLLK